MQIGNGKRGVKIGEYAESETPDVNGENRVIGYVQPLCDNPSWILWFTEEGDALLYTERDPSGGVIGEPIRVKAKK